MDGAAGRLRAASAMDAEDPLFILYTSGSTGKPKGVLHTTGGYLVYASYTHKYVFDLHEDDIYWCTADIGWVTGHSYIVYGPLANGATTLMFEGVPDLSRRGALLAGGRQAQGHHLLHRADRHPRADARGRCAGASATSRASLRLLGTVGEPINPEAWLWYHRRGRRRPLPDRRHLVADRDRRHPDHAAARRHRRSSRARPRCRSSACGRRWSTTRASCSRAPAEGNLVLLDSWPGQMRTVYGDHAALHRDLFHDLSRARYFTGDGCRRDEDGYYWITGRVDDVINVSGHRMGTAEVESALVAHPTVAEAAVVGCPHDIKGQGIYAYVTLKAGDRAHRGAAQGTGRARAQGDRRRSPRRT